jgi:hypothetical protein
VKRLILAIVMAIAASGAAVRAQDPANEPRYPPTLAGEEGRGALDGHRSIADLLPARRQRTPLVRCRSDQQSLDETGEGP